MRVFLSLTILFLSVLICGCAGTIPQASMVNEEYIANADQFEVIGDVIGMSEVTNLFGLIFWGDRGYQRAYQSALKQAQDLGAEGLICVYSDVTYFSFLGIYNLSVTYVFAKAYKRKE